MRLPMMQKRAVVWTALVVFTVLAGVSSTALAQWEEVTREQGVVVHSKAVKDRDLPIFKGVTTINAPVVDILAVLNDTGSQPKWMHQCVEATLLKQINDMERIIYNRTDAPWPVDDRDIVLQSKATVNREKRTVTIRFWSIKSPLKAETDEAVRMPRLRGHYVLKILDYNKTRVEYQIDADPGGMLPDWLIESASKDIPLNTLTGLKKRVAQTRKAGTYKEFTEELREKFDFKAPE